MTLKLENAVTHDDYYFSSHGTVAMKVVHLLLGWKYMELEHLIRGLVGQPPPAVVAHDVNSLKKGESNSMPRKNEDFRNALSEYCADVDPIETRYWVVVALDPEEEQGHDSDGGPIGNAQVVVVVVVQNFHDEGVGVESCSTPGAAASCSILVVEAVGHLVLNVESSHTLQRIELFKIIHNHVNISKMGVKKKLVEMCHQKYS